MSSGEGGGGGGGGGGDRPLGNCDDVNFQATIRSPKIEIVARLKDNDLLSVVLDQDRATIVVETSEHERVGSLMSGDTATLIACLQRGYRFVAVVRSKQGGVITVHVRPRTRA